MHLAFYLTCFLVNALALHLTYGLIFCLVYVLLYVLTFCLTYCSHISFGMFSAILFYVALLSNIPVCPDIPSGICSDNCLVHVLFFHLPVCGGVKEAGEEAGDDVGFEFSHSGRRRVMRRGGGGRRKDKLTYIIYSTDPHLVGGKNSSLIMLFHPTGKAPAVASWFVAPASDTDVLTK